MAKRVATYETITPTATADTTDLVDSTYPMALVGSSSTQRCAIGEVWLAGQATSSAPTFMILGLDSQLATGSLTKDTALNDVSVDSSALVPTVSGAATARVVVFNKAATLKPRRDVAGHLAPLSFNAFGGNLRLQWWDDPFYLLGNAASFGEISLSAFTGGTAGALSCYLKYEPV